MTEIGVIAFIAMHRVAVLPGAGKCCQRSPVPFSRFPKILFPNNIPNVYWSPKVVFLSRTKPASMAFHASAGVGERLVEGAAACPADGASGLEPGVQASPCP